MEVLDGRPELRKPVEDFIGARAESDALSAIVKLPGGKSWLNLEREYEFAGYPTDV